MMLKPKYHPILTTALILLSGGALAIQPLLGQGLARTADGLLHFYRLAQLERAIAHGDFYPRWLPDLGFGFGFPLFHYYAPLSYYLLLPIRALGFSVENSLQMGYALALGALAIGVYGWGQALFGKEAGFVAAFATLYSPYILYNLYGRGALPELWGLVWLSWCGWWWHKFAYCPNRHAFLLAVFAYAALLLTHNILALICTPLLGGYALLLVWKKRQWKLLIVPALSLALTAFFWLPALWEKEFVQIQQLYAPAAFHYANNYLSPAQLFALPVTAQYAQLNPNIPFGLGLPQLFLAALGLWQIRRQRITTLFLASALLLSTLMTLPISQPIWSNLPLLYFTQFPWRFLGPASLLLALLAGATTAKQWPSRGAAITLPLFALCGMMWLFPTLYPPQPDPTPAAAIQFEAEMGVLGMTSAGDYLPIWVKELPASDSLLPAYQSNTPIPRLQFHPLLTVHLEQTDWLETHLLLTALQPTRLHFLWYYFPGWQATLDGQPISVFPDGSQGLLSLDIPDGQHDVHLSFGTTPLRQTAETISLITAIILFGYWILGVRSHAPPRRAQIPNPSLVPFLLMGLALFGVKTFYLDHHNTIFRQARFDGQQMIAVDVPLQVNFGNQLILIGYDMPASSLPADHPLLTTLYWRAVPPVANEYSVALHLVDSQGRVYGQHDQQHPGATPTNRWQTNEYARDTHTITPWLGAPPGIYQLLVTVYEPHTGRRLELLNADGLPIGDSYVVAQLQLTPPVQAVNAGTIPMTHPLNANLGEGMGIIGANFVSTEAEVGHPFLFTFFWQATTAPSADYRAQLRLVNAQGQVVAEMTWHPGGQEYPTSDWAAGAVVRDDRAWIVPAQTLAQPTQPIPAGRYQLQLQITPSLSPSVLLTEIVVQVPARSFEMPAIAHPTHVQFGDFAILLGYDLPLFPLSTGQTLPLTLYWQASGTPLASYKVFVHLLHPNGEILAQQDSLPVAGTRPTTGWVTGEIITDLYQIYIPDGVSAGIYTLKIGLYDPITGTRLAPLQTDNNFFLLPTDLEIKNQ